MTFARLRTGAGLLEGRCACVTCVHLQRAYRDAAVGVCGGWGVQACAPLFHVEIRHLFAHDFL